MKLFLCGDVMTGRGVDQVLPYSCPPHLYEPYVTSALDYVALAERRNGPIRRPVEYDYVWGDALDVLERARPDVRIVNLETAVTTSEDADRKGINYRMHPRNVPVLAAAGIDCCVLANNHVMDWGERGLLETLDALSRPGIAVAGAGRDLAAARAPAVLQARGGRVLVFGLGAPDSGIPRNWAAGPARPGVHLLPDFSEARVEVVRRLVAAWRRPGDIAVASIHWGGNWGYEVPETHRRFARGLVERASIDLVHGHSSHHPKAVEIHDGRAILYGCGDFLDDYEGVSGYEEFRAELVLVYFATMDPRTGRLLRLEMMPLRIRNLRLERPTPADRAWLREILDRECRRFGRRVRPEGEGMVLE